MNSPQPKSLNSNGSYGTQMLGVVLPDELIEQVLSFLPVKSLLQLRCVCKWWKTLISNSTFVKLHHKRSARNKITAVLDQSDLSIVCVPVHCLLKNASITLTGEPYLQLNDDDEFLYHVGSYNGLLCLVGYFVHDEFVEISLYLWNPATRTLSNKIEFLRVEFHCINTSNICGHKWNFAFGYDNSTDTYKIVAFCLSTNEVRVLSFGDNLWRNIQCFPVVPFDYPETFHRHPSITNGVCVSSTINWLADLKFPTVGQFVIISLDLSTETYLQLMPPRGFDKVSGVGPTLAVLMDSLCYSHDFHGTDFIIWQMKKFGVEESWTQFLKISYRRLLTHYYIIRNLQRMLIFPLSVSENGGSLILACGDNKHAILYNLCHNNRVAKTSTTSIVQWFLAKDYTESLVSTS